MESKAPAQDTSGIAPDLSTVDLPPRPRKIDPKNAQETFWWARDTEDRPGSPLTAERATGLRLCHPGRAALNYWSTELAPQFASRPEKIA